MVENTLEAIAMHRYGSTAGLLPFSQVAVSGIGTIDCVLARHAPMQLKIEDFVLLSNEAERKRPIKRLQLEVICRFWGVNGYVIVSEQQFSESTVDKNGSLISYNPDHLVRLVVCRVSQDPVPLSSYQFASVAGDVTALSHYEDIDLPSREEFSRRLSNQMRRTMRSQLRAMVDQKEADYVASRCPLA
jgi:hypothetical protein